MTWRKAARTATGAAFAATYVLGVVWGGGAGEPVAAHVVSMSHPAAKYTVLRDNRNVPITFNLALKNGDVVVVGDAAATMSLRFVDHNDVDVTKAMSPYKVQSSATKPEVTSNFLLTLWQNVTKSQSAGLRSTSTRDVDPTMAAALDGERQQLALLIPGLSDGTARIAAGDRHVMLRWSGGHAPYRVILRRVSDGVVLADEADIPTKVLTIRSHTVALAPARYAIEVRDSSDTSVQGGFESVAGLGVPDAPSANDDPAQAAIDAAAVLAAGDDRSLYYEAYLRLYDALGKRWDSADALAAWLASGAQTH